MGIFTRNGIVASRNQKGMVRPQMEYRGGVGGLKKNRVPVQELTPNTIISRAKEDKIV